MWLDDSEDFSGFNDGSVDFDEPTNELRVGWVPEADILDADGKPVSPLSFQDMLIGVELILPQGEEKTAL